MFERYGAVTELHILHFICDCNLPRYSALSQENRRLKLKCKQLSQFLFRRGPIRTSIADINIRPLKEDPSHGLRDAVP